MELGIRRNQLFKWEDLLHQKGDEAFTGVADRPRKDAQNKITTLKQENAPETGDSGKRGQYILFLC